MQWLELDTHVLCEHRFTFTSSQSVLFMGVAGACAVVSCVHIQRTDNLGHASTTCLVRQVTCFKSPLLITSRTCPCPRVQDDDAAAEKAKREREEEEKKQKGGYIVCCCTIS